MTKDDYFTNPYKTYLDEKYKEEDLGHLFRQADGKLVPKSGGYHKWNGSGYDWIPPTPMKGGFKRPEDSMKPSQAPKTAPTNVRFQKASDQLAASIAAAIKAAQDEIEHKKTRKAQIKTKEAQGIIKRDLQIKKTAAQLEKEKKDKGWFGEQRVYEGIFSATRDQRILKNNPQIDQKELDQQPHGTIFSGRRFIKVPDHILAKSNDEVLNWVRQNHGEIPDGVRIRRRENSRIDWDSDKPKPTVHESLFTNPFKTTKKPEDTIGHDEKNYNGPVNDWRMHWYDSWFHDYVINPSKNDKIKFSKKEIQMVKDAYHKRLEAGG